MLAHNYYQQVHLTAKNWQGHLIVEFISKRSAGQDEILTIPADLECGTSHQTER